MANPKERTIHGTKLCVRCAERMPVFYMMSISDRRAAPELKLKTRRDAERLWLRRLEIAKATERLYHEGRTFEEALSEAIAAAPTEATWQNQR